jgi:hypothetical protein
LKRFGPETFGEQMADGYDAWYGTRLADATTQASAGVLADLAAGGAVLELGIGTGRVALPLAARGLSVHRSPFTASSSGHVSVYGRTRAQA